MVPAISVYITINLGDFKMFNSEVVKELAHSNATASAIFLALSQRERARRMINLDLLKRQLKEQKVQVSDKEFFLVFKALQKHEIGDLIYGRKGNPDVFVWYYDLKDVAMIGLGSSGINSPKGFRSVARAIEQESRTPAPKLTAVPKLAPPSDEAPASVKVLKTDGKSITISIPIDLLKSL